MSDKPDRALVTVITDAKVPVILSYPHIATAQVETDDDDKPTGKQKYSGAFIFTKEYDLTPLRKAVLAAAEAAYPGKGANMLASGALKNPLRSDWEDKGYPEGSTFTNARTEKKPGCVYSYPDPATGKAAVVPPEKIAEEFYAGARVRVSLTAFAYNRKGNKGVSFALNNLQKIGDGERMDGRVAAENEFTADLSQTPADFGTK